MSAKYVVGVDLGTTHTVCAYAPLSDPEASPVVLPLSQLTSKEALETKPLLPSAIYFPHDAEGQKGPPWDPSRRFVVGEYARSRSFDVPSRVVLSAKSWLCHPTLDRRKGHLPLGAPSDVEKISPVEASFRLLEHVAEAWEQHHGKSVPLSQQEVVLTVPASFDPAARELTVEAALASGLENLSLLEEPQAAVYAWLGDHKGWRKELRPNDVILVVDIGGGTTDFSAILVSEQAGGLELVRMAVGHHILLGGDNMDLALAYHAKQRLESEGKSVDAWQLASLTHACRAAKELLLCEGGQESVPVAALGKGTNLFGGALRLDLLRHDVSNLLVDGFFPHVEKTSLPVQRRRSGLAELGLPYASDPSVTKHLASFVSRANAGEPIVPTHLLLNGGVMKGAALRTRLCEVLATWFGREVPTLSGADFDFSVARGAVAYGLSKHGRGIRIRSGTSRAYYVGVEGAAPAVPGVPTPMSLLCVAPLGMEEGTVAPLAASDLGVVVGEPVGFRFFGSTTRREDTVGTTLHTWRDQEMEELSPVSVTLPSEGRPHGEVVPIQLRSTATEVGTLLLEALPLSPKKPDEVWKVELSVREV